ncbi:MFS transporter [Amycolatopsis sp. NPDC003861]
MVLGVTRPLQGRILVVVGVAVVVVCSVVGVVRAFVPNGMGMAGPHGMPLTEMPEMFLAGAGILLAVVGMLLRTPRVVAAGAVRGRRVVAAVATAALTIDVSKTSTLGFVIPGMRAEYGIGASAAAMLAVGGLSGTATGALVFSRLSEHIGRRGSYLLATLGFTATSMCGCMPTFAGNVVMCFLMGIAVGGLAPLLVTMLADLFPGGVRGPAVAGLSMVATAIGYLVASSSALWLEPTYGWRVLWLIGTPAGILLAAVAVLVPEPTRTEQPAATGEVVASQRGFAAPLQWLNAGVIGLMTFGLTTWVPTLARTGGLATSTANALLTAVAAFMVPSALLLTLAYRRVGAIPLVVRMAFGTAIALLALAASGVTASLAWLSASVLAVALFSVNTMAAVFLPVSADLADSRRRGRVTGTVSFFNRLGGLLGPLVLALIVSSVTDVLWAVAALALSCGAVAWFTGRRHRRASRGKRSVDEVFGQL